MRSANLAPGVGRWRAAEKCCVAVWGGDPTSPRVTPENIGPQRAEWRRTPALVLLVSLTSGLLLLLLLLLRLLRPRARQPY